MICAVTSRKETCGDMPGRSPTPFSRGLGYHLMAGGAAGFAELTLGGNPLSVLIANQISGDPIKVKASLGKGWFSHYYGQSYLYNLGFRVPFLSAIMAGIYFVDTQVIRYPNMALPVQIAVRAMGASSFSLPFVLVNDWLLANRVNNNIDFQTMMKAGVGPLIRSARRSLAATWLRETMFISGPICSARHLRDWMQPRDRVLSDWERLSMTYFASAVTGVVAAVASHPFHVVAVTQQSSSNPQGLSRTTKTIVQKHGLKHLGMAGLAPRLARIGLCSGIIVGVLDWFSGGDNGG